MKFYILKTFKNLKVKFIKKKRSKTLKSNQQFRFYLNKT